jgi:hypothetical protein
MSIIGLNSSKTGTDLNDGVSDTWTDAIINIPVNRVLTTNINQRIQGVPYAISPIPSSLVLRDSFGAVELGEVIATKLTVNPIESSQSVEIQSAISFKNIAYETQVDLINDAEGVIRTNAQLRSLAVPDKVDDITNKAYVDSIGSTLQALIEDATQIAEDALDRANSAVIRVIEDPQTMVGTLSVGSLFTASLEDEVVRISKSAPVAINISPNANSHYAIYSCDGNNTTHLLSDPQSFSSINDFFPVYISYVSQCDDFSNVDMYINLSGYTVFTFTIASLVSVTTAFGLSASLAEILGFAQAPVPTQTFPGVGTFYVGVLGPLFQYTYISGQVVTITSTYPANTGVGIENTITLGNSIISATNNLAINAPKTTITGEVAIHNPSTPTIVTTQVLSVIGDISCATSTATKNAYVDGTLIIGNVPDSFASYVNFQVKNPVNELVRLSFDTFLDATIIHRLNQVPARAIYAANATSELSHIVAPTENCSILTQKAGEYTWLIPYSLQLVSNPYINSPGGTNINPVTTLTIGTFTHLRVMASDDNTNVTMMPVGSFQRVNIANPNTSITYLGNNDYTFRVNWSLSAVGSNNQTCDFALFINETLYEKSLHRMVYSANSEFECMSQEVSLMLSTNDVISVRCKSSIGTITMYNYNMAISVVC